MEGIGVFHSHTGITEQRSYIDGICHGPATLHTPQVYTLLYTLLYTFLHTFIHYKTYIDRKSVE